MKPAAAFEKWKSKLDLTVLSGGDANDMSISLFNLQKESTSLTKSLLPPSQRRRSTLGFVNQMMFTKRVGAAWKNAIKGKKVGEDLEKVIQDLTVNKLAIAKEIKRLQDFERDASLSLQQLEILDLQEKNKEIRFKLTAEVNSGNIEADTGEKKKSIFEKLKEENAVIHSLREEIRMLKDEQVDFEEKLKLVRKGGVKGEEVLMSSEDKEEMDLNVKRLRRQVRGFQRAIKVCRDKWTEMKKEGKVPESSGARKLRESIMQRKILKALGGGGELGGLLAGEMKLPGQKGEEEKKETKLKVLQFGFGMDFGGAGGMGVGGGEGGGGGGGGEGRVK